MLYFIISFHFILHLHETLEENKKLICQQQISSHYRHEGIVIPCFLRALSVAFAKKAKLPQPHGHDVYNSISR
jgi:hypothetical protein